MRAPRRRAALAARTTLPLLLLLAARSLTPARAADVIASSKLEACIADGGSSAAASSPPPLACSQKLVLAVAVDASDAASASSSRVELTVPCVGSPTGACPCPCDYARDAGCGCRDLERGAALGLAFAKTPVYAAYPLTYLQSFNWRPTEQIIRPQSSKCRVGETGGGGGLTEHCGERRVPLPHGSPAAALHVASSSRCAHTPTEKKKKTGRRSRQHPDVRMVPPGGPARPGLPGLLLRVRRPADRRRHARHRGVGHRAHARQPKLRLFRVAAGRPSRARAVVGALPADGPAVVRRVRRGGARGVL